MNERLEDFLHALRHMLTKPHVRLGRHAFYFWSGSWSGWGERDPDGPCLCHEVAVYFGPFGYERRPKRPTAQPLDRRAEIVALGQARHEVFMAKLHADWTTCLGCGLAYQRSVYPRGCPNHYREGSLLYGGSKRSEARHRAAAERRRGRK